MTSDAHRGLVDAIASGSRHSLRDEGLDDLGLALCVVVHRGPVLLGEAALGALVDLSSSRVATKEVPGRRDT